MPERSRANYKICLLGDHGTGKTSLIRRYVLSAFSEAVLATIGVLVSKRVEVLELEGSDRLEASLVLWDIMGSKNLVDLLGEACFLGMNGALAAFDVTRRESLNGLAAWVEAARKGNPRAPIIVLGKKSDLADRRQVSDGEAADWAQGLGLQYMPTSAKSGLNVEAAFHNIAGEALRAFVPQASTHAPLPPKL